MRLRSRLSRAAVTAVLAAACAGYAATAAAQSNQGRISGIVNDELLQPYFSVGGQLIGFVFARPHVQFAPRAPNILPCQGVHGLS